MAKKKNSFIDHLAEIISTVFYIGKIRYAPGTFGSLAAFPVIFLIGKLSLFELEALPVKMIFAFLTIMFVVGVWASDHYCKKINKKDPGEIVIDEFVGQILTTIICLPPSFILFAISIANGMDKSLMICLYFFIIPFIFFRAFDIIKPWPLNKIDEDMKGGFGIMLDDIAAAIYSALAYCLLFGIIHYVKFYVF